MTITVEIDSKTGETLIHQATSQGLAVDAYASALLERAAMASVAGPTQHDIVDLFAPLRGVRIEFERDPDTGRELPL